MEKWIDNWIKRISDNGNGKLADRLLYITWSIRPRYITSLTDGDYEQYHTKTPENFYKCYLRGIVWKLNFRSHCKNRKFGVFFYRPDLPSHT